jgi:Lar family restriction alleviation protein
MKVLCGIRETPALLPCPFCGGKAEHHDIGNARTKSRSTKIWCTACHFSKNVGAIRHSLDWTRAHAIEAWNRRTTPPACEGVKLPDWRPISTAPKDGTPIIGAFWSIRWADSHRKGDVVKCWYQPEFEAFISSCRQMTMAPGYTIDGKESELHSPVIEPVTHWMPLSTPSEGSQANLADANSDKNTPTHHPSATEGGEHGVD